jgi:hypothetical protein
LSFGSAVRKGTTVIAPLGHLHELADLDRCLEEGAYLIAQAEERVRAINQAGASEGCRRMGAQILKAMGRTLQLMQDHRVGLAQDSAVVPVAPSVPQAGRWWPLPVRRRAYQPKTL